jgi:hypothetical protein
VQILNDNQTIWIRQAKNEDAGRYTCSGKENDILHKYVWIDDIAAENKVGNATKDFIVRLTGK